MDRAKEKSDPKEAQTPDANKKPRDAKQPTYGRSGTKQCKRKRINSKPTTFGINPPILKWRSHSESAETDFFQY
jgi:hypothetical protein